MSGWVKVRSIQLKGSQRSDCACDKLGSLRVRRQNNATKRHHKWQPRVVYLVKIIPIVWYYYVTVLSFFLPSSLSSFVLSCALAFLLGTRIKVLPHNVIPFYFIHFKGQKSKDKVRLECWKNLRQLTKCRITGWQWWEKAPVTTMKIVIIFNSHGKRWPRHKLRIWATKKAQERKYIWSHCYTNLLHVFPQHSYGFPFF